MSAFLLRKNLNKLYFKSWYQLTRNLKILPNNGSITKIFKLPMQNQLIPANHILRSIASKSITIKQYESNRLYTLNWKLERVMGWSLMVLIPMAFAKDSQQLEMVLCSVALLHTYWGCQSMCSDYLRSEVVGKALPIIVRVSIVLFSLISLAGAYQLIYEDVGLINMIKKFWTIRGKDYVPPKHLQKVEQKIETKSKWSSWF